MNAERQTYRAQSAGVTVRVFPIGIPGQVILEVTNLGPDDLSREEMIRTLRMAAHQLETADRDDEGAT